MPTTALSEAETRVMQVVWQNGGKVLARVVAQELGERYGYSHNATYTLISRCIKKGALERIDPGYVCRALISLEEVQAEEADGLIDRLFSGSPSQLFASLVGRGKITQAEIDSLRTMAAELDDRKV